MKIGFRIVGFREWPISQALAELARLGYDGVELCLEHPDMRPEALTEAQAKTIATTVRDLGLDIASVSYHGDRDAPALRLDNQRRSIHLARALGCDLLILNAPRRDPVRLADQWHEMALWIEGTLLPEAERAQARLAFEPEPGLVLHGTHEMLRLLSHLPHPLLGVNLDIGHAWLTDADVTRSVRQLAPWLWHVHWEDFPRGEHRHLPPAQGDMPLAEIHEVLQQIGYDGYTTVDLFDITDDPRRYAEVSLQAMRELFGQ